MKRLIFVIIIAGVLISLTPKTANAGWHAVGWYGCDCSWGVPDPWDPWWECPCYWDVWLWCYSHPYWMWPWWARQWVSYHYSSCGHYYYVYYDYYVPSSHRVYVDGRYRYRYSVELDRSYSRSERIPRRNGFERPMPSAVESALADRGPEYRIKDTPATWTSPEYREYATSRRSSSTEIASTTESHRSGAIEEPTASGRRSGSAGSSPGGIGDMISRSDVGSSIPNSRDESEKIGGRNPLPTSEPVPEPSVIPSSRTTPPSAPESAISRSSSDSRSSETKNADYSRNITRSTTTTGTSSRSTSTSSKSRSTELSKRSR